MTMAAPTRPDALDECLSAILASPNFSVADYLNTALAEEDAHDTEHSRDLQRSMAELAMQLQLQTQSCHEDIARIGAELQAVLPRCAADVARVGVGLQGLQMDTTSLLQATAYDYEHDESNVSSSLETLTTLHALQANLTRTREILTAAATWDETLEQVQQNLAHQNLVEAVHGLAVLNKGERALRGMPDPEARVRILDKVRTQVGTLLQPQLSHALAVLHSRVAPLQQCVTLYQQLERMPTLTAEYVKQRPMALHKQWFEYTPPLPVRTSSSEAHDNPQLQEQQRQQPTTFASWLPGWFDAVLSLVVEERRQATTIFGAALVPEIVVQVFRECFRPILPSFKSRLDSVCSSNPNVTKTGSLQEISTIYESMLQFLSLSYETVVGGWLDMVESASGGSAVAQQGPHLYHDLMEIFVFIASPFAEYQRNLPKLEAKYLGEEMQALTKQMQQATMAVNNVANVSLDVLQAATDQLQELSTAVVPLAESAVARFELLNGGYAATPALLAVDRLLAGHASELALAVHKLSAALRAQEQSLELAPSDNAFDEPHVLCAMQVLKVAGKFARGRRGLEQKSRERLVLLSERVDAHSKRQKQVQEALQLLDRVGTTAMRGGGGKTGSHNAFQLSDSLSIVEIDSLLTRAVCVGESDEEFGVAQASLQSVAVKAHDNNNNNVPSLYPEAEESAKRLTHSCHTFVYEVCSSVPRMHLSGMSSMAAWKEGSHHGSDQFASYGTLPQEYITHVGEHMLALVQALEPFASDKEALALANEVMDGVRRVAQQPWLDFIGASGENGSASLAVNLMDGKELEAFLLGGHVEEEEDETEEDDGTAKDVTAFCNAWLDVVGLAVTGRLLERIMRIPFLTPKGCEHLSADLGYLVNVFSALGVTGHPHPLIGHFAELVTMDNQVLAERIASFDRRQPLPSLLRSIEERMLAMRSRSS